jgi:ribosomal protein S18 acetylase RimI-like enzyme
MELRGVVPVAGLAMANQQIRVRQVARPAVAGPDALSAVTQVDRMATLRRAAARVPALTPFGALSQSPPLAGSLGATGGRIRRSAAGGRDTRVEVRDADAVVGSASVRLQDEDVAELTDLEVASARRGRGFGVNVVADAARRARTMGAAELRLTSDDSGSGHLDEWYRSLGFEERGVDEDGRTEFRADTASIRRASERPAARPAALVQPNQRFSPEVIRRMKRSHSGMDTVGTGSGPMDAASDDDVASRRRVSTRKRQPPPRNPDYVDEDKVDDLFKANPASFGLGDDEVEEFIAENEQRENKVDDSVGGSRGGMSGSARSDKGDEALAIWLNLERPQSSHEMIRYLMETYPPIRWTLVDLDDRSVGSRIPDQQEALSHLPPKARAELAEIAALLLHDGDFAVRMRRVRELVVEFQKDVSANRVMAHKKPDKEMDRGGFEILHMSGRAVGNPLLMLPPDVLDDIIGAESMASWTGRNTNQGQAFAPSQHPGNLAIGSFGANTMMMAIEGKVSKEEKDFTLETFAYAPRGSRHLASHIVMKLHHKPSDQTRWYYIPGTARYTPRRCTSTWRPTSATSWRTRRPPRRRRTSAASTSIRRPTNC